METRLTSQSQAAQAIFFLQTQANQLATVQEEASTGLRINKPSDDPSGMVAVLASQAQDQRYTADLANISSATSILNQSVSALNQGGQLLTQAQQIATEAANGTNTASSLETLAQQVDNLINNFLAIGNTQIDGHYIFGGTASTKPPFSVATTNAQGLPETIAYNGTQTASQTTIGSGQTVETYYPGNQVFQTSGQDAFQALITLRDTLRNVNGLSSSDQAQSLSNQIGSIQQAHDGVLGTVSEQSNSLQNLSGLQTQVQSLQLETKSLISSQENADMSSVLVQYQAAQNSYQATLAVSARLFNQNLLNFLSP